MSNESELVINVWETFKDFVPSSKRSEFALDLMRHFSDFGFEAEDLEALVDEDVDLTEAYQIVYVDDLDDDDDEYGEE